MPNKLVSLSWISIQNCLHVGIRLANIMQPARSMRPFEETHCIRCFGQAKKLEKALSRIPDMHAESPIVLPKQSLSLQQSFSRGFSHGFLSGVDHQELVQGRFPKSRGVQLGKVVAKTGNRAEAFEDILWSLLNSTEFQTKR